jgi:hypothetical protein
MTHATMSCMSISFPGGALHERLRGVIILAVQVQPNISTAKTLVRCILHTTGCTVQYIMALLRYGIRPPD